MLSYVKNSSRPRFQGGMFPADVVMGADLDSRETCFQLGVVMGSNFIRRCFLLPYHETDLSL